jgi:hypothetical protein
MENKVTKYNFLKSISLVLLALLPIEVIVGLVTDPTPAIMWTILISIVLSLIYLAINTKNIKYALYQLIPNAVIYTLILISVIGFTCGFTSEGRGLNAYYKQMNTFMMNHLNNKFKDRIYIPEIKNKMSANSECVNKIKNNIPKAKEVYVKDSEGRDVWVSKEDSNKSFEVKTVFNEDGKCYGLYTAVDTYYFLEKVYDNEVTVYSELIFNDKNYLVANYQIKYRVGNSDNYLGWFGLEKTYKYEGETFLLCKEGLSLEKNCSYKGNYQGVNLNNLKDYEGLINYKTFLDELYASSSVYSLGPK